MRGLTSLEGLTSSATIRIAANDSTVSPLHAQGGGYDLEGSFHAKNGQNHGLFLDPEELSLRSASRPKTEARPSTRSSPRPGTASGKRAWRQLH